MNMNTNQIRFLPINQVIFIFLNSNHMRFDLANSNHMRFDFENSISNMQSPQIISHIGVEIHIYKLNKTITHATDSEFRDADNEVVRHDLEEAVDTRRHSAG